MRTRDTAARGAILALGIGYGAGMMWLLDPVAGRRRRALIRDQVIRLRNDARWWIETRLRNAANHVRGSIAEVRAKARERAVPDDILADRVRARLGHVTSYPGSLDVIVHNGHVTVCGPVLSGERARMERRLSRTRGVRAFTFELREQQEAGRTPGLQGQSHWQQRQQSVG